MCGEDIIFLSNVVCTASSLTRSLQRSSNGIVKGLNLICIIYLIMKPCILYQENVVGKSIGHPCIPVSTLRSSHCLKSCLTISYYRWNSDTKLLNRILLVYHFFPFSFKWKYLNNKTEVELFFQAFVTVCFLHPCHHSSCSPNHLVVHLLAGNLFYVTK